jgi:enoyl-CoA hydratase
MSAEQVRLEIDADSHIAQIILDRSAEGNLISADMARAICDFLTEAESNDGVKVVVLSGDGDHLSRGWDSRDAWRMYVDAPGGATRKFPSQRARLVALDELWWGPRGLYYRLLHCRKVTILRAHGECFETGLYFALCCDLTVAADGARFANPRWANVGVDGDMSLLIASVGLKRAKELMFCAGVEWTGEQAKRYGLVDFVVPPDRVRDEAARLAAMCASIMRDGIVTEKYAVFASLEKMGVGLSFAAATVVGASMSNLHYQPGEFNFLKELRDKGADAAVAASRSVWSRP